MDIKKIEELLTNLSYKFIELDDGDLVLISEIIDDIEALSSLFIKHKPAGRLLEILEYVFQKLFEGKNKGDFEDIIIQGIDLLQRFPKEMSGKKGKDLSGLLSGEINEFLKKYQPLLEQIRKHQPKEKKQGKKQKQTQKKAAAVRLNIDSEPLKIFLVEVEERIIGAQDYILSLENDLKNKDLLNKLFRVFHTIKGECGFLKLASFGELAHNLENLLDLLRNDEIENNPGIIDILLSGIDYANKMIGALKAGDVTIFNEITLDRLIERITEQTGRGKTAIGEVLKKEGVLSDADVANILHKQKESSFTRKFGDIAVEENIITEDELQSMLEKQKDYQDRFSQEHQIMDPVVKVKASQINFLVDMIGELLITVNQMDDNDRDVIQLKKITRDLRNGAMQLRTTKVKNLFSKMKRVVRDVSRKLEKQVRVEIIGEDLEIDRNLVESLEEPLIHLLRNAVYHGIESEAMRKQKKKDPAGLVTIKGERHGNNIIISVSDDGKGLDKEKILKKALDLHLVTEEQMETLSGNRIYNLIFEQGFSTAEKVDYVSGRGVGMDIVRTVAKDNRGKVEIRTVEGEYTEIRLVFPLSTAIIDGMIVRSRGVNYIIPVSHIIESLNLTDRMVQSVKETCEVINLREEIIPVIRMNDVFSVEEGEAVGNGKTLGVIVENNEKKKYVFIVDEILAKKEIVIKSLGGKFTGLKGIVSGTVLQGGKIGFVVDVDQVISTSEAAAG